MEEIWERKTERKFKERKDAENERRKESETGGRRGLWGRTENEKEGRKVRKEGRKVKRKVGRKEGRKGRNEGRKMRRKEGRGERKEGK